MSELVTPDIPVQRRNLTGELNSINQANIKYAPDYYNLEAKYGPQYNRLDISNLGESLLGYTDAQGNHIPGQIELNRAGTNEARAGDISDVVKYGPAVRDAYLNANPWLRQDLGTLTARTQDSPVLTQLNQGAQQALGMGGQLSPQEIADLQQQTRAGFAARGMVGGPASLGAEILSRDSAQRARLAAAQDFAGRVEQLNQGQSGVVGQATGITASALADPFAAILGRSGGAGSSAINPATIAQSGQRAYSPPDLTAYGNDLFTYNANAQNNRNIALSNAQAGTRQAIATVASGFIGSDLRLKENIQTVGQSPSGIPIVEFNYKKGVIDRSTTRYRGAIAQDVEKIKPEAVFTAGDGIKYVRYDLIDVPFEEAA